MFSRVCKNVKAEVSEGYLNRISSICVETLEVLTAFFLFPKNVVRQSVGLNAVKMER